MKKWLLGGVILLLMLFRAGPAAAHFAMIIPSDSMIGEGESRLLRVTLAFSHPFEGKGRELARPVQFGVVTGRWKKSLLHLLERTSIMGHGGWTLEYRIPRRGVYTFYMEQRPYWESAQDRYLRHLSKTVISCLGDEKGWEEPLGLKTEIVPLTRPFGLYAGNVFQGIVMLHGKPVPHGRVEVVYYNREGKAVAPAPVMRTQVVRTDTHGVFTYAAPRAGWWGFAALNAVEKMKHRGEVKDVELGALLWVEFHDWQQRP